MTPKQRAAVKGLNPDAPIVIGGIGGSGTRVVAAIAQEAGVYIGPELNPQLDNTWFTILFKRPSCFRDMQLVRIPVIQDRLDLFTACMLGGHPGIRGKTMILKAAYEVSRKGHNHLQQGSGSWAWSQALHMLRPPAPPAGAIAWGWKEPNSHVYLEHMVRYFPGMKYVHVMRHGLDMAYTRNHQQYHLWRALYRLTTPAASEATPRNLLTYWIRANERAMRFGNAMGDRFLAVRYDDLCRRPKDMIPEILRFLGSDGKDAAVQRAAAHVSGSDSIGRYRKEDLSWVSASLADKVRELGFEVER